MLLSGASNVARDTPAALRHLKLAANHGQPDAQAMLGLLHASGLADRHGIKKSLPLALLHWTVAAGSGNIFATTALGFRHLYGLGVQRSCRAAAAYYKRAAFSIATDPRHWPTVEKFLNGRPPLPRKLKEAERGRFDEDSLLSSKEVSSDDFDVVQFHIHSAEHGDSIAMTTLGGLQLYGGYGLDANEAQARVTLRRAADAGNAEAHGMLGHLAMNDRQNETAILHFRHSAATNDRIGHYALGMIFLHGLLNMEVSYVKAAMHFRLAAEENHADACFQLGLLYWKGKGVVMSHETAFNHFQRGAQLGSIQAKLNVGLIMLEGLAPLKSADCELAVKHLKPVAEQGEWRMVFQLVSQALNKEDYYGTLYRLVQAAHAGIEIAQFNAALLYETVDSILFPELEHWDRERVLSEAHELYELSGMQGYTDSLIRSGNVLYTESKDYEQAVRVFVKAAELKNAEGMVSLGLMYAQGLGVKEDRHLSLQYLVSASHTDPEAIIPATIALFGLRVYWFIRDFWKKVEELSDFGSSTGPGAQPEHVSRPAEKGSSSYAGNASHQERFSLSYVSSLFDNVEDVLSENVEDILVVASLFLVLVVILSVRRRRLERQTEPRRLEDRYF